MTKFYVEFGIDAAGRIPEGVFDALADALYDLEAGDQAIEDTDLGASLAGGHATVTMTVDAGDQAQAGTKALATVRAAIHAIGGATPGWETDRGVMRVAPADASDRLFTSA